MKWGIRWSNISSWNRIFYGSFLLFFGSFWKVFMIYNSISKCGYENDEYPKNKTVPKYPNSIKVGNVAY